MTRDVGTDERLHRGEGGVGDHDHPEIGVIARRLGEGIPGARLEIVAGADHYLPLRAPERLTEILAQCS